jgi:hypothetical protein
VGYFDGMEEGTLRANVIEAKVNNVAVRYERPRNGESDNEIYSQGEVVPAEKIISAAGFKVRRWCWCLSKCSSEIHGMRWCVVSAENHCHCLNSCAAAAHLPSVPVGVHPRVQ